MRQNPNSFFETPEPIARTLAAEISKYIVLPDLENLRVLDLCAGTSRLAIALMAETSSTSIDLELIDIDRTLLEVASTHISEHCSIVSCNSINEDCFSPAAKLSISKADVIICNPPFKGYRKCSAIERELILKENLSINNDLACAFVVYSIRNAKLGALLGFVIRRDMIYGRGYSRFREILERTLHIKYLDSDCGKVMSASSSTNCALVIGIKRETGSNEENNILSLYKESPSPEDWIALKSIANVVAGPNTGADSKFLDGGADAVIKPQSSKLSSEFWSSSRLQNINWSPNEFSQRRNLKYQGCEGVAYRIAGANFTCSLLPKGCYFLSRSPAILPIEIKNLDFISGLALSNIWKSYARAEIRTTNFSPGSVAELRVPYPDSKVGTMISKVGGEARNLINEYLTSGVQGGLESCNSTLLSVDLILNDMLDSRFENKSLYWGL